MGTLKGRCEMLHGPNTVAGTQIEKAIEQGAKERRPEVPPQEKTARDIDTAQIGSEGNIDKIAGNTDDAKSDCEELEHKMASRTSIKSTSRSPAERLRCSVTEMLKRDAAWADRLLRGVALVASRTTTGPVGL